MSLLKIGRGAAKVGARVARKGRTAGKLAAKTSRAKSASRLAEQTFNVDLKSFGNFGGVISRGQLNALGKTDKVAGRAIRKLKKQGIIGANPNSAFNKFGAGKVKLRPDEAKAFAKGIGGFSRELNKTYGRAVSSWSKGLNQSKRGFLKPLK